MYLAYLLHADWNIKHMMLHSNVLNNRSGCIQTFPCDSSPIQLLIIRLRVTFDLYVLRVFGWQSHDCRAYPIVIHPYTRTCLLHDQYLFFSKCFRSKFCRSIWFRRFSTAFVLECIKPILVCNHNLSLSRTHVPTPILHRAHHFYSLNFWDQFSRTCCVYSRFFTLGTFSILLWVK